MKISLFVACMNREENIKKCLPSWENQKSIDEIIILDYGSDTPLNIPPYTYRVEADTWQLGKAYNIAESICTGDIIIKVDTDYILNVDIIEKSNLQSKEFYTGRGKHKQAGISGFYMGWKKDFDKVNGYNERLSHWGYDDTDFFNRLENAGCIPKNIKESWITHIPHPKQYNKGNTNRKNMKSALTFPWTINDKRSRYINEI